MQIALLNSVIKCSASYSLQAANCRVECEVNTKLAVQMLSHRVHNKFGQWIIHLVRENRIWQPLLCGSYRIYTKYLSCLFAFIVNDMWIDPTNKNLSQVISWPAMSNFSWRQTQINATFPARTQYWVEIFLTRVNKRLDAFVARGK